MTLAISMRILKDRARKISRIDWLLMVMFASVGLAAFDYFALLLSHPVLLVLLVAALVLIGHDLNVDSKGWME